MSQVASLEGGLVSGLVREGVKEGGKGDSIREKTDLLAEIQARPGRVGCDEGHDGGQEKDETHEGIAAHRDGWLVVLLVELAVACGYRMVSLSLSQSFITLGCDNTKRRYDIRESCPVEARVGEDAVREKKL